MKARINIIQGSARAGKTFAMLILLCDLSFEVKDKIISITTDSYPNLERGAMRDWEKLLKGTNRQQFFEINRTKHTWKNIVSGTTVEFFSCDSDDALGAARDYLFVNEANRIDYETFSNLELRTTERIWLDFNPVSEFYAHTELLKKRTDCEFIKLTYKDNEAIPENVLKALLQRKGDGTSNWWRVFGLGEIGSLEGNVYEGWTKVDSKPEGFVLKRYGLDFGFSNDPTACVAVYENEAGEIYLEPKLYETKLLTPALIERIKGFEPALFVCDNARPEIIAEMQHNGLRAIGSDKTAGEKMNGKRYNIELVQRRKIFYSGDDIEKEFLTYAWRRKKSGEQLDEPQDGNDHYMDAISYAIRDMSKPKIDWGGGVILG